MHPRVLLLDEPLGALDLKVRKELQIELKRIQEEIEFTFVYVTHDQEEALAMSDRVVVMNGGHIEQIGVPHEIYDSPATEWIAGFIGDTNFIQVGGKEVACHPRTSCPGRRRRSAGNRDHDDGDRPGGAVHRQARGWTGGACAGTAVRSARGDPGARRGRARLGLVGRRRGLPFRRRRKRMSDELTLWEQPVSRRGFMAGATAAALAAAGLGRFGNEAFAAVDAAEAGGTLNFYNWAQYVNPKTYPAFTKATGVKVKKSFYDSNETLHAKLKAGARGYDLICPSNYMTKQLIKRTGWSRSTGRS